jgi:hypothetical protein
MMIAPVAPTGWPSAIAPPFRIDAIWIKAKLARYGTGLRGKGFVAFNKIKIINGQASAFKRHFACRYWPHAHDAGWYAAKPIGNNTRHWAGFMRFYRIITG